MIITTPTNCAPTPSYSDTTKIKVVVTDAAAMNPKAVIVIKSTVTEPSATAPKS